MFIWCLIKVSSNDALFCLINTGFKEDMSAISIVKKPIKCMSILTGYVDFTAVFVLKLTIIEMTLKVEGIFESSYLEDLTLSISEN